MECRVGKGSLFLKSLDKDTFYCDVADLITHRTGKALILATKSFTGDRTFQSWWSVLSTIALLVIGLAGSLLSAPYFGVVGMPGFLIRLAFSIVSGLLLLRLFVIYHDHQHRAILPKSRMASGLMRLIGLLILSPTSIWTSSHNHHHHHNSKLKGSNIGSFPVMTKERFLSSSHSEKRLYLFMRHPLTILFGYVFIFLYGMCLYPFFDKPRAHWDCLLSFLLHLAIGIGLLLGFGWQGLILGETIPLLISGGLGAYLFYAQHNFPTVSFHDKAGWTYEKAALESSSYMHTGPVMAWFTANIGYHHIHHLNALIPFYRLPEAFAGIPELNDPKRTSLRFYEIVRCLRLKVWDVPSQRMVAL